MNYKKNIYTIEEKNHIDNFWRQANGREHLIITKVLQQLYKRTEENGKIANAQ